MTTENLTSTSTTPALTATSTTAAGSGTNVEAIHINTDGNRSAVAAYGSSSGGSAVIYANNSGTASGGTQLGIYGRADGNSGVGGSAAFGVYGYSQYGQGVFGTGPVGVNGDGSKAVVGDGEGAGGIGVQAYAGTGASALAGDFHGNVSITGNLTVSGSYPKSWRIDHPLDPENKFLLHACIESPDLKNLYDGTQTADPNGELTVDLPDWFEKLNTDLRYQLTAMGAPAPQLHVKQAVSGGRFVIAGAAPGQTICWQVTGNRHDPAATKNPFAIEQDKSAEERGLYLDPAAFGQPMEKSIHASANQARAARKAAKAAAMMLPSKKP